MTVTAADPLVACLDYLATYAAGWHRCPDINRRYVHVLWTFAECAAAKTILEIGIGPDSVSGCTFIASLGQRGGHLVSVDVDPNLPQARCRALAEEHGVTWTVVHGDSLSDETQVPLALESVDLLYIDGDHDAAHAEGDLKKYLPYLRPGGYLLIDDFPPQAGVGLGRAAMEQVIPAFLHLAHDAPDGNGRLVWQRPL